MFICTGISPSVAVDTENFKHANGKSSGVDVDWWPMYRHDLDHTGNTTSLGPESNAILWSYNTGGWVVSSPTVVDDKLYIGSYDDNVYCLDAETGELIWNYSTLDDVRSSPAILGGKVYIGSDDHKVYCLDAIYGTKIWEYTTGDEVYSSPSVSDGKVYIGSRDQKVYCLNAVNGDKIWDFITGDELYRTSPAVSDGKVYIGSYDQKVYCLDAVNGDKIWDYPTGGPILSSPSVSGGRIYFGSGDFKVYCLNALNGSKIWDYKTGDGVPSSPAVAYDKVYIGSKDYKVYCLDALNGSKIWDYTTGYPANSPPAVADGKVYTASGDGDVYCLDAFNGSKIWNYTTGDWVWSSPAVVNGIAYIGSNDGIVYAFISNDPPYVPGEPYPENGSTGVNVDVDLSWDCSDPDEDDIVYDIYFEADDSTPDILVADNQIETTFDPGTLEYGTVYYWKIIAIDEHSATTIGPIWHFTTEENMPPDSPIVDGPNRGKPRTTYEYGFTSVDPEEHDIAEYIINWDDGTGEEIISGPFASGQEAEANHTWDKIGTYTIKAKAKDSFGAESNWSEFEVEIPRTRATINLWYQWLFERFPLLERMLNLSR